METAQEHRNIFYCLHTILAWPMVRRFDIRCLGTQICANKLRCGCVVANKLRCRYLVMGTISVNCSLNKHYQRIGITECRLCRACMEAEDTLAHVLFRVDRRHRNAETNHNMITKFPYRLESTRKPYLFMERGRLDRITAAMAYTQWSTGLITKTKSCQITHNGMEHQD